jgi:hypothetical protein
VNLEPEVPQPGPAIGPGTSANRQPKAVGAFVSWIVLLAIAAFALALAAAHLPPIFKKIGLFAVAYGVVVGLIGAWLRQFAPGIDSRRRLATAVVVVLALVGQMGIAAESFRIQRSEQSGRDRADPNQALARRLLESATEPPDPKSRAALDEFRRSYSGPSTSFGDYLQYRVSSVGIHSKPAAAWFWAIELMLGGLAAGWVFGRRGGAARLCRGDVRRLSWMPRWVPLSWKNDPQAAAPAAESGKGQHDRGSRHGHRRDPADR